MRLYKVVILVNVALVTGFLAGYHWWGQEVIRLTRELAGARQAALAREAGERSWSAKGIVRGFVPEMNVIVLTHEPIPGLMGSMTMGFRTQDPKLLRGLDPGDLVQFTLKEADKQLIVVALRKEKSP